MNKKRIVISSILICLLIIIIVLVVLFIFPYYQLMRVGKQLVNKNYNYEAVFYVEGLDIVDAIPECINGNMSGEKDGNKVHMLMDIEEERIFDIFWQEKNMLFNIKPIGMKLLNSISGKNSFQVSLLSMMLDDIYISTESLEAVLQSDFINEDVFEMKDMEYDIEVVRHKIEFNMSIPTDELSFYKLLFKDNGVEVIVGIGKDNENILALSMEYKGMYAEFYMEYDIDKDICVDIPEDNFTETASAILQEIYLYWIDKSIE